MNLWREDRARAKVLLADALFFARIFILYAVIIFNKRPGLDLNKKHETKQTTFVQLLVEHLKILSKASREQRASVVLFLLEIYIHTNTAVENESPPRETIESSKLFLLLLALLLLLLVLLLVLLEIGEETRCGHHHLRGWW